MSIKLVSFDVWNTLVKANELYKYNRAVLLAQAVSVRPDAISDDFVDAVMHTISQAEDFLNSRAAATGQQYGFGDCIRFVCEQQMGVIVPELGPLYSRISDAFLHDLPELAEPTLPIMLATLKERGFKLAITSNTGFVAGNLMRAMLASVGLYQYVDFGLFSDEIGAIVPSTRAFTSLQQISGADAHEILHVSRNTSVNQSMHAAGIFTLLYAPGSIEATEYMLRHLIDLPVHPILAE